MSSLQLTVYRDQSGFDALEPEWNALLARSSSNQLFLTWEWQSTWWRCLGEGDLWLLAWRDAAKLLAIVPLYLTTDPNGSRRFSLVGCIDVSDYLDFIIASGHEQTIYSALLDWLETPDAPAWDVLDLCNLPQASPTHRLLPELAAQRGWRAVTDVEDVCPVIELPTDWEAYLEGHVNKKQRHEIRRKLRRAEREAQVHWYVVNSTHSLPDEMDAFISLHRLSTQEKHSFMTPHMENFFHAAVTAMHRAGWLYLAFLELNGEKAGAVLAFHYRDRLLVYNSGYNPGRFAELSPGIVLTSTIIQDAINRGIRVFDFLQGDEEYKYRFGATDTLVYRTQIARRGAVSAQ